MFSDYIIDIIFKILKCEPLDIITPVSIKFETLTGSNLMPLLFDIDSYTIPVSAWTTATSNNIKNNVKLTIAETLIDYNEPFIIKFFTSTNIELLSYSSSYNFKLGSLFEIPVNGISITIPNVSNTLGNFILNYLFKGVTTGKPATWFLQLFTSANVSYGARQLLTSADFSKVYTDHLGFKCVSYGKYINYTAPSNAVLARYSLYSTNSGGSEWFSFNLFSPFEVKQGRPIELFNNTIKLALAPKNLNQDTYLPLEDSNVLFACDYNGTTEDYSEQVATLISNVTFSSSEKLFKSECAVCTVADVLEYQSLNFPASFTLQLFIKFINNPIGREITFLEKQNTLSLNKTDNNLFKILINDTEVLSTEWLPSTGIWYHIYIYKATDSIVLIINDSVLVNASINIIPNINSNKLVINKNSSPILGFLNGLYIHSGLVPFNNQVEPSMVYNFNWKYITPFDFAKMNYIRWKKYNREYFRHEAT